VLHFESEVKVPQIVLSLVLFGFVARVPGAETGSAPETGNALVDTYFKDSDHSVVVDRRGNMTFNPLGLFTRLPISSSEPAQRPLRVLTGSNNAFFGTFPFSCRAAEYKSVLRWVNNLNNTTKNDKEPRPFWFVVSILQSANSAVSDLYHRTAKNAAVCFLNEAATFGNMWTQSFDYYVGLVSVVASMKTSVWIFTATRSGVVVVLQS
jgi:hypothetical protein